MKWGLSLLAGLFLWGAALSSGFAASLPGMPVERARMEELCAWAALAAYNDRVSLVARSELEAHGWTVLSFQEDVSGAIAGFSLIGRELPEEGKKLYILAVTGTENLHHLRFDMNIGKVLFGGTTPEEFSQAAERQDVTAKDPMVHGGFDEYTQVAFFRTEYDGQTIGEKMRDELLAHPEDKLYLTGHSLGGAVATLLAARLAAMGVPEEQLVVISFGAPAVGNAAFVRQYGDPMCLDRVIIRGDPVGMLLQALPHGYAQFNAETLWRRNPNTEHFHHEMVVYADAAIRNYYDRKAEAETDEQETEMRYAPAPAVESAVYIAPITFSMDPKIRGDVPYMKQLLQDALKSRLPNAVFGEGEPQGIDEACRMAKESGCQYVLIESFSGTRIKDENYNFLMAMQEEIYDADGQLVSWEDMSTDTRLMTPIDAVLYEQAVTRDSRETALSGSTGEQEERDNTRG